MVDEIVTSLDEGAVFDEGVSGSAVDDGDKWSWPRSLFTIEYTGRALIIVPTIRHGMFRYATLQTEANTLRRRIDELPTECGLVVDLRELDYLGSEAIGAVVALARKAEDSGVHTVFCCAAPPLRDALINMGLNRLWPLHATREEAIEAVAKSA